MPCIRHGAGLLFCPDAIQPNASVYNVFCRVNAIIQSTPQNSAQGFTGAFPAIAPAQPPTIPDRHNEPLHHLRHAGTHTNARTRCTDTRYHRHAEMLYRSAQAAYYNNVYKRVQGCALLWIHARRCSIPQTMPARRGQLLPCADRLQVLTACQQYRPGGVSMLPTPGGLQSGTGSAVRAGDLAPSTRRAVQQQGAAGGAEPLAAAVATLFGLSPDSQ